MSPVATRTALLLLTASLLSAQPKADWAALQSLPPGAPIRVEAAGHRWTGQFHSAGDDGLVFQSRGREETMKRAEVLRVDVKKRSHHGRNALIGLAVGGGIGAGIGIAASRCGGLGCIASRDVEIAAPVALGLVGGVIGAVIPSGGWREVYRR